jgi:hypothetical protein
MATTGVDDTLSLEAVYFSAPIPHNLAVLTILGAVFDKIYFPGVFIPRSDYDPVGVQKEIEQLEALEAAGTRVDPTLMGMLRDRAFCHGGHSPVPCRRCMNRVEGER